MSRILIAGCGDIGTALGNALAGDGHYVAGLKRRPPANGGAIHYIQADLTRAAELSEINTDFDQVIVIVTPDRSDEESYRRVFVNGTENLLELFSRNNTVAAFTFVSSTSVYGQTRGEWVDETSPTESHGFRGQVLLAAESAVLSQSDNNTIVRFSGIYGPGRERLLTMARQGGDIQYDPPYFTNRIHRDDCIGVLKFIVDKKIAGQQLSSIYLASDDDPAPLWEIIAWLATRLDIPPPGKKYLAPDVDQNKRCRNTRLKELGYHFLYPSYTDGYEVSGHTNIDR